MWKEFIEKEKKEDYFLKLDEFLEKQDSNIIFPPLEDRYKAYELTAYNDVKVVILGQDPYHQKGQAMGLAFSVPSGVRLPPSLRNIYREISSDLGITMQNDGDLTYLAKQGVFLLNTSLTVEEGKPLSHNTLEYETLTAEVLMALNKRKQPIVFLLWGAKAKVYEKYINGDNKLVLKANHPSPLSANRGGFFGCKHFSKTNKYLKKHGLEPINWQN